MTDCSSKHGDVSHFPDFLPVKNEPEAPSHKKSLFKKSSLSFTYLVIYGIFSSVIITISRMSIMMEAMPLSRFITSIGSNKNLKRVH